MNYKTPEYREYHTEFRRKKYGHKPRVFFPDTFWALVEKTDSCWNYKGFIQPDGYGHLGQRGLAHRVAYTLLVGPIPIGLTLDHLCRNKVCVNPAHLEPVTLSENIRRNPRKTHCIHGHLYSDTEFFDKDGKRSCRICSRATKKRWEVKNANRRRMS